MRGLVLIVAISCLLAGCGGADGAADADATDGAGPGGADGTEASEVAPGDPDAQPDLPPSADAPAGSDADGEAADAVDTEEPPACPAPVTLVAAGLALEVTVDVSAYGVPEFPVKERVVVTPPQAGQAISLFGEGLVPTAASAPYRYDGHVLTLCVPPYQAGETVSVDLEYVVPRYAGYTATDPYGGLWQWGLDVLTDDAGRVVVGPFSEPYHASRWLFVPQSLFAIDPDHDANVHAESVRLTVQTPDASWTVFGPGGVGARDGTTWVFDFPHAVPLYALSFAASPDYEVFPVGTSQSGITVTGAVFPPSRAEAEQTFQGAVQTLDWMEAHLAPYEFGSSLALVEVPSMGFGGMENTGVIWVSTAVIPRESDGFGVAVHETVHHWWGDSVRYADWPDFWLGEGLTEWSSRFDLAPDLYGADDAAVMRATYRFYAAAYARAFPGALCFSPDEDMEEHFFSNLGLYYVYGAAFFEMVNQRLRRDFATDLRTLLVAWYGEHRLGTVTTADFLAFLQAKTGDDASWHQLFADWVYGDQSPVELVVSDYHAVGGTIRFFLGRLDEADLALTDLTVAVATAEGVQTVTVDLLDGSDTATIEVPGTSASRIVIDPDQLYILGLGQEFGWKGPTAALAWVDLPQ